MAVVVDQKFFNAMGPIATVKDVSNCDIAWFIVAFHESDKFFSLSPGSVKYTTLEHAVEGLTAGRPVSLSQFEQRIKEKLNREKTNH